MGERCGLPVEVEFPDTPNLFEEFWTLLKSQTGGLPGQPDDFGSKILWTLALNDGRGDKIGVSLTDNWIKIYLRASDFKDTPSRAERMLQYSRAVFDSMSDQELVGNEESDSKEGRSIAVRHGWVLDDRGIWQEAAVWIKDQSDRLQEIAERLFAEHALISE